MQVDLCCPWCGKNATIYPLMDSNTEKTFNIPCRECKKNYRAVVTVSVSAITIGSKEV